MNAAEQLCGMLNMAVDSGRTSLVDCDAFVRLLREEVHGGEAAPAAKAEPTPAPPVETGAPERATDAWSAELGREAGYDDDFHGRRGFAPVDYVRADVAERESAELRRELEETRIQLRDDGGELWVDECERARAEVKASREQYEARLKDADRIVTGWLNALRESLPVDRFPASPMFTSGDEMVTMVRGLVKDFAAALARVAELEKSRVELLERVAYVYGEEGKLGAEVAEYIRALIEAECHSVPPPRRPGRAGALAAARRRLSHPW